MHIDQNHQRNKRPGETPSEFFRIYGITIFLAFAFATYFKAHFANQFFQDVDNQYIEVVDQAPLSGEVACFDGAKKIFARIFQ